MRARRGDRLRPQRTGRHKGWVAGSGRLGKWVEERFVSRRMVLGPRSEVLELAPHPGGATAETLASWAATQSKAGRPLAVDLFSGAGGLSAGIEAAGWAVAAAVDLDRRALETHRHNFPGLALQLD